MSGEFPTLFEREPNLKRFPRIVPMLIALACAVVLTSGSIYGYLATCNFDSKKPANKRRVFLDGHHWPYRGNCFAGDPDRVGRRSNLRKKA